MRAYDAEQAGDLHMLVMEYVEGLSLAELHDAGRAAWMLMPELPWRFSVKP